MMNDDTVTPLRRLSPATSGYQLTPELLPNHRLNSPGVVHTYLPGGGATAGVSNQQPAVRPKLTNQSTGVHDQQLQYRTPAPQPHDGGVDAQHTTAPPILSPYGDHYAAPLLTGIHVTTTSLPPQPPTGNQIMQQPAAPSIYPHPTGIYQPASQDRAGYAGSPTVPQGPLYSSASGAWGVHPNRSNPQFMNHAAYNHTDSIYGHSQAAYDGFLQTHQVRNVPVFTGNADSRMLVEDWIRDMQYVLEAIELLPHLRFFTVVRHLSGEARKLVLNLPLYDQTRDGF
ncbi:hypothetical protein ILYODFUR_033305 [Ilyodon furcidens]|uniref:Uncharacterized protein n=1 Tax=Ilyodon furcidens TaxID=33524 RepID=A0ABV0UB90_9TELE